jgi:DNA-binding transcriptional LysR family regulator
MFHKRSQTTGKPNIDLHDMSLRALQVFAAVEECGSLTDAGSRLGGSRSAISQQLTNLEKVVGAKLLDRTTRPISLTPVGHIMSRHAHHILQAVSEARTELMALSESSLFELRLGIIDDLDASITPDVVTRLRERYERCQLTVTSGRSDDLSAALARRSVDLILTGITSTPAHDYQEMPVLREPFMLVAPRGVLDSTGNLREQMLERPFIRYNASMPIGQLIAQHLRRLRIELPGPFSFDASRSVFAMMVKCRGWTISTPLCVLDGRHDVGDLEYFPLPFAGFSRTIRIVTRRDELEPLPQYLADLIRDLIETRLRPEIESLASWLSSDIEILGRNT